MPKKMKFTEFFFRQGEAENSGKPPRRGKQENDEPPEGGKQELRQKLSLPQKKEAGDKER